MGKIKQKCPYCGSSNIARYFYGFPLFEEEMVKQLDLGELVLGGCCVHVVEDAGKTVFMDPSRRCNDCKKNFGTPAILVSKDMRKIEHYVDIVTGIRFFVGGYGGPNTEITFKKTSDGARIKVDVFPFEHLMCDIKDIEDIKNMAVYPKEVRISDKRWKDLLNILYNDMHLHEWEKHFYDFDILDGTQWSMEITLTNRRRRKYHGSNAFPPYWKQLLNIFKKHAELDSLY